MDSNRAAKGKARDNRNQFIMSRFILIFAKWPVAAFDLILGEAERQATLKFGLLEIGRSVA